MTLHFIAQIKMHKKDLDEVQRQNNYLQNQVYELESRGEVPATPQKRQYPEASGSGGSLYKRPRVNLRGCSREQIRNVLGGPDRGWGSMQYASVSLDLHLPVSLRA